MEMTLAILFAVSALLFIISIVKTRNAAKAEMKEIESGHMAAMNEINQMQESIRNMELDIEVVMKEAGVQLSSSERQFMREVLDLYKRKYSVASIAAKHKMSENDVKDLLAPYIDLQAERRTAANEG